MSLLDDIDRRIRDGAMKPEHRRQCRVCVDCFSKFLGREATREDLTDENIAAWLDSLSFTASTIRHRRDAINGLRQWIAANPDPNAEQPGETIHRLDQWRWTEKNGLQKRREGERRLKLTDSITADFASMVRKKMDPHDINPDVFVMLLAKWKRDGMRAQSLDQRLTWFIQRNHVAAELGWCEVHDFSHIHIYRTRHWTENRQNLPMPEPLPEPKLQSDKAGLTLIDFLNQTYVPARLVGKSQRTVKMYRITINAFGKWLGRPARLADLTTETVSNFLRWLMENTELSPATIEKDRVQLSALWRYAARKNILAEYPDIMPIRVPERVPDAWSNDDMQALLRSCDNTRGVIGQVEASKYWSALVCVIYDTAERISAVMQIEHSDIDRDGWLTVRGEYRKGKTRDKRYRLRPETIARIKAMNDGTRGKVFKWPYNATYIWRKFGDVLEAAGLPNNRRTKFHKLRRTTASNFSAAGGDAQALLDHTSRRTTMRYLDPRTLKEVMPADLLPGIGQAESQPPEVTEGDTPEDTNGDALLDEFKKFLQNKRGA